MKTFLLSLSLVFVAFSSRAANFTAVAASGNYSTASTWTFVGSDADGIPDNDDDIVIPNGKTVILTATSNAKNITINPGGVLSLSNKVMNAWGNFTNNGSVTNSGGLQFLASGVLSGNAISLTGGVTFYSSYTIASGMYLACNGIMNVSFGYTVTNNGNVTLNSSPTCLRLFSGSTWRNANGSILKLRSLVSNSGTIDASATSNAVIYQNNGSTSIVGTNATYYNLSLTATSSNTKAISGNLTILNNFTIGTSVTVNCSNFNITIGGNWTNNANLNCTNRATVTFNGTGTQTITRSGLERFKDLVIAGSSTVVLAANINCSSSLTINSGSLDVSASNFSIAVQGNFIDSGVFNARSGTVTMNGTSAQIIDGSSSTSFFNLTTSNTAGVTVNFTKTITNLLTVSAGSFGPSASGTVILTATGPTTYARIGVVGGTLTGTSWIINTYINGPATAYWQYLSTPVNGNTVNDWDSDPRFYMSGVGGNDGNACCPTFYSVRTYNTSTNAYPNVTSLGTALVAGRGYMVWMGDNLSTLTAPLIYDNRGTPNFGNITRSVVAGGSGAGYNLVGNPYACPVNYSSVQAASGNIGASFMILQENGSYVTNPNGGVIAPSQGFMCIASSTGNMTFTEACKNTSSVPNIIRQAEPMNYVRINVTNDQNGLGGETAIQFNDQARNGYDLSFDMPYLPSPYETASNLWTTDRDGKDNILNALDAGSDVLEIPLTVEAAVDGNQTITFRGINRVTAYSCAWMENTETGERINLREKDSYSFFASAGSKSSFILHFDRTGNNCPLAQQNLTESLDAQTQVYVANDMLMAKFFFTEATDVQIVIYDAEGREVAAPKQYTVSSESIALESPGAHGVYFVQVIQADRVTTKKIYY